jgi:hypothetical protein
MREPVTPEVGMGASICVGSDSYAATIIEVSTDKKKVVIQEDKATRAEGFDYFSNQVYDYEPNEFGAKYSYSLRKNGYWHQVGQGTKGSFLSIGNKREYQDPSF